MALNKLTIIDKIEVLESGHIQVRRATYILEDGIRIAGPAYHRNAYSPGDDIVHEETNVQAHAQLAWTPEVIAAYRIQQQSTKKLVG